MVKKVAVVFSFLFLVLVSGGVKSAVAQDTTGGSEGSLGIAHVVGVADTGVPDGSILSNSEQGVVLSNVEYDPQVVGVVARDAAIVIDNTGEENGVPVISNGTVYVMVSTQEGPIKTGDLLATSTIPGVAVKAVKSGYVLGAALEDYDVSDPKVTDKIAVDLNLHYFNTKPLFLGSLTDIFKLAILPVHQGPTAIFKYIVAAIVILGSLLLGFLTFGRTAAKGVEALGRNPAASRIIHLGIAFNVVIVIVIVTAGLFVAFLILRL